MMAHQVWILRQDTTRQAWQQAVQRWRQRLQQPMNAQSQIEAYEEIRQYIGGPSWTQLQKVWKHVRTRHADWLRLPEAARERVLRAYLRWIQKGIRLGFPRPLENPRSLYPDFSSMNEAFDWSAQKSRKGDALKAVSPPVVASPPCHPAERDRGIRDCEEQYAISSTGNIIGHMASLIGCAPVGTIGCILFNIGQFISFQGVTIYQFIECIRSVRDMFGDTGCEFQYYYNQRDGWYFDPIQPIGDPPPGWPRGGGGGFTCVPVTANGEVIGHCCGTTLQGIIACARQYGDLN